MPDADTGDFIRRSPRPAKIAMAAPPGNQGILPLISPEPEKLSVKYEIIKLRDGTRLKLVKTLNTVRKCHRKSLEDFSNFQDSINQMELLRVVNPQINRYAYGE